MSRPRNIADLALVNAKSYGAVADGTDQTAKVQDALDTFDAERGGILEIPFGVKFNLKNLTFPKRSHLRFRMDDDLSRPNPETTLGTNEWVEFIANANNQGAVNEYRLTAPFSLGLVQDLRSDVRGHDDFLVWDQDFANPEAPLRLHTLYGIDQAITFRQVQERYRHRVRSADTRFETFQQKMVLTGTGSSGWANPPVVGDTIEGLTSLARGVVRAIDTGTLTIQWLHGAFVVGEMLRKITVIGSSGAQSYSTGEVSQNVITATSFESSLLACLAFDPWNGGIALGTSTLTGWQTDTLEAVGGVKVVPWSAGMPIGPRMNTNHPGYFFGDNPALQQFGTHGEMGIVYDTVTDRALRRLHVTRGGKTPNDPAGGGAIIPSGAHVVFDNSAVVGAQAHNVASVARYTGGAFDGYFVNFTAPLATTYYHVTFALYGQAAYGITANVVDRALGSILIEFVNAAGTRIGALPAGISVSVKVDGGDM